MSGEAGAADRSLSVGVGARRGVSAAAVCRAVTDVLRGAGLSPAAVAHLATVDARAAEPGLPGAARRLGAALLSFSPAALGAVEVPNPSQRALRSAGTPSVAEAAALLAAGEDARLLVPKRAPAAQGQTQHLTVAVAVARERGTSPATHGGTAADAPNIGGASPRTALDASPGAAMSNV